MDNKRQPISKEELLKEAIVLMKECNDYVDGVMPTEVKEMNDSLVFSGEYFLQEDGTPSTKTLAVFNVFKFLNMELSKKYYLKQ